MPVLTIYFQLHQPFRLHPERDKFFWEEMDGKTFLKVAEKCYLPAISMMEELISENPGFKITLGLSGTFLEQAELYKPEVVKALQKLLNAGNEGNQIEFLDETYYHSLVSLFADPKMQEFQDQVSLHRDKMRALFGVVPASFRNTDLIYNNAIAETVADMGYQSMLCEMREDMFAHEDNPIPSETVFRAKGNTLIVIPRNSDLSNDIACRFSRNPVSPEQYAANIAKIEGDSVMLGFYFEHMGDRIGRNKGIFEFWRGLPEALARHPGIILANPSEVVERFRDVDCPILDIHGKEISDRTNISRDTFGWLDTLTQYELFKDIENLEGDVKRAGGELLKKWRHMTTSDHVYFLHERMGEDRKVHFYLNPYEGSVTQAARIITRKIDYLETDVKRFEILKKGERTAVLIIAPETGRLPEDMGLLAKFISGKSGGLGEVITALCEGLTERGIDCHLATMNLKKRFQKESHLDEKQWREIRYAVDPDKVHLVTSSVFADLPSAYSGNPGLNAAEFQKEIVNHIIKTVKAKSHGKLVLHSHDWMAGGVISAYSRSRGFPLLHTVHNVFTGHVPLDMLLGINLNELLGHLYFSDESGMRSIDCQATAIKNATLINFVGQRFLEEVVNDYFSDRHIIPPSVRQEVKAKYYHGAALSIINAPSPGMYPERCNHLVKKYGPNDDIIAAKKKNLVEFQKRTGLDVNPDAILLYWPSRLDPAQKGVELLEDIALKFVIAHGDVQMAIVADGVGGFERTHEDIFGRIAWASKGKIAYHRFSEELSMLGYAAASDVFGASLYEPCGQIDQIGNLFGATATNRDTGGYHDKIRDLKLKIDGSPQDVGNGFLFRDYNPNGLWYGLKKSVRFHRKPEKIREKQMKRIMKETREKHDLQNMVAKYIRVYERLNSGKPLA